MASTTPCDLTIWSPIVAAGAESTFSGILAGFVFLGMIAIWTVEHPAAKQNAEWSKKRTFALQFFSVAFIVLALDSYLTAITSGEADCNRASVEEAFSGGALGIGAAVMFAGLAWQLVTLSERVAELKMILRWMLSGLVVLIVFMLAVSAVGIGEQLQGDRGRAFVDIAPWALGVGLLVAVLFAVRRGSHSSGSGLERAVLKASLAALAEGFVAALCGGLGGAISTSYWAKPPAVLVDVIVVLIVFMPGIALVLVAAPALASVARDGHETEGTQTTDTAHGDDPEAPHARKGEEHVEGRATDQPARRDAPADLSPVEPMTPALLRQRTLDTFSGGYLTFIAIIQGVALTVLADRAQGLLTDDIHHGWMRVAVAGQATSGFIALLVVTYEYLWFTSIMGWPLTFVDTLVPYCLGAGEIVTAQNLGDGAAWWGSFAVMAGVGVFAFLRTRVKCAAVEFENDSGEPLRGVVEDIRRLTAYLMASCGSLVAWSLVVIWIEHRKGSWVDSATAIVAWSPAITALVLVVVSERGLNKFYGAFGLDRLRRRAPRAGVVQPAGSPATAAVQQ